METEKQEKEKDRRRGRRLRRWEQDLGWGGQRYGALPCRRGAKGQLFILL